MLRPNEIYTGEAAVTPPAGTDAILARNGLLPIAGP